MTITGNLLKLEKLKDVTSAYDVFLFDLWGVIIEDNVLYPGVIDAINEVMKSKKVMFVSNAPRPDFKVLHNLHKWGITNATIEMVVTSGDLSRKIIDEGTDKIYHLGSDRNDDLLIGYENRLTEDISEANIVMLSIYRDEGEDINEFDNLLRQIAIEKKLVICANPDTIIPKRGIFRYCSGYFAEKIEAHGGKVIYTGKPKSIIYDEVLMRLVGIKKDRILMIGDTFETDILGARESGIKSALVLTGNAYRIHEDLREEGDKITAITNRAQEIGIEPDFLVELTTR